MKTLKEIYNLQYDKSGFNSGLIQWYNKLIDKTPDNLDIIDVSKMVRQNILKKLASNRAIDLFFYDPYDGEYEDGGLLSFLITLNMCDIDKDKLIRLKEYLPVLELEYLEFDWENDETKGEFIKNLRELKRRLIC